MARQTAAEKRAEAEAQAAAEAEGTDTDEPTEGSGEESTEESSQKRAMPTFALDTSAGLPVDALPSNPKRATRDQQFVTLLTPIVKDDTLWGQWFSPALYRTPTGAREAQKAIDKGDRQLPAGVWEHVVRKVDPVADGLLNDGETTPHRLWSRLYFRFLGTDIDNLAFQPANPDAKGNVDDEDEDDSGDSENAA